MNNGNMEFLGGALVIVGVVLWLGNILLRYPVCDRCGRTALRVERRGRARICGRCAGWSVVVGQDTEESELERARR